MHHALRQKNIQKISTLSEFVEMSPPQYNRSETSVPLKYQANELSVHITLEE